MVAEFQYFPFSDGDGADSGEDRWIEMMKWMRTTGIVSNNYPLDATNDSAVTPDSGLTVKIGTGSAFMEGTFFVHSTDPYYQDISENMSGDDRIDRITIRTDFVNNITQYYYLEGTPDPSPSPPPLVQNSNEWDSPLAQIYVADSAVTITSMDITDERERSVQGEGGSLPVYPNCFVYKNATTTGLTDSSTTTITFDTAILNPSEMWDDMNNPERITIGENGIYYVRASTGWVGVAMADGPVEIQIVLNGTTTITRNRINLNGDQTLYLNTDVFYSLSDTDYLELDVINDTGQTLSLSSGADGPSLQTIKIST